MWRQELLSVNNRTSIHLSRPLMVMMIMTWTNSTCWSTIVNLLNWRKQKTGIFPKMNRRVAKLLQTLRYVYWKKRNLLSLPSNKKLFWKIMTFYALLMDAVRNLATALQNQENGKQRVAPPIRVQQELTVDTT